MVTPDDRRNAKARVRAWASDLLGSHSDEAPRCEEYPRCGGEDGDGHLQYGESARRIRDDNCKSMATYRATIAEVKASVAHLPTCKLCKAYAREVDRLLRRVEGPNT